jgi:hypothetical protein
LDTLPSRQKVLFGTQVASTQLPAVHSLLSPQSAAVRQLTHLPLSTSQNCAGQSESTVQTSLPASGSVPSGPASGLVLGVEVWEWEPEQAEKQAAAATNPAPSIAYFMYSSPVRTPARTLRPRLCPVKAKSARLIA